MSLWTLVCLVAAVALLSAVYAQRRNAARAWLPPQLRAARLVHVEEDFVTDAPFPVIGRPDQVYRDDAGVHTLVELKHRDRVVVYDTDIAEISLRAWLLRQNGCHTSRHGFVVVSVGDQRQRRAIEVDLLDDNACLALIQRYVDLVEERRRPRRSAGPKCRSCGHATYCH